MPPKSSARSGVRALSGRHVIQSSGLVVARKFIDLHQHDQDIDSQRVKELDGVATALELEIGAPKETTLELFSMIS